MLQIEWGLNFSPGHDCAMHCEDRLQTWTLKNKATLGLIINHITQLRVWRGWGHDITAESCNAEEGGSMGGLNPKIWFTWFMNSLWWSIYVTSFVSHVTWELTSKIDWKNIPSLLHLTLYDQHLDVQQFPLTTQQKGSSVSIYNTQNQWVVKFKFYNTHQKPPTYNDCCLFPSSTYS